MIVIKWKGKIGYGDIVSPICYAHNISYQLQQPVQLRFRWEWGPFHKIDSSDPETLTRRADYIFDTCKKDGTQVELIHDFNTPLDINHTSYDWDIVGKDPLHNFWEPEDHYLNINRTSTIVFNTTRSNIITLEKYGKSWKDPVADKWDKVYKDISRYFPVVDTGYRTPITTLFNQLKNASLFVGYHGTTAWVARFLQVPSVIISRSSITSTAFPHAVVLDNLDDVRGFIKKIPIYRQRARERIAVGKRFYKNGYALTQAEKDDLEIV